MMHAKNSGNMVSLLYKPILVMFLLFSLFGLVWLRSSVVSIAYELRSLEEQKMIALRDMKLLLADRADLMSIEKVSVAFRDKGSGNAAHVKNDSPFQNRVRVVHLKKNKEVLPYRASLKGVTGTDK